MVKRRRKRPTAAEREVERLRAKVLQRDRVISRLRDSLFEVTGLRQRCADTLVQLCKDYQFQAEQTAIIREQLAVRQREDAEAAKRPEVQDRLISAARMIRELLSEAREIAVKAAADEVPS